jgi:hypothetical protein
MALSWLFNNHNFPSLYLMTLTHSQMSQQIFTLTSLHNIIIKVEIQNPGQPYTVLQLPVLWSHLDPLQVVSKMSLVWGWPCNQECPERDDSASVLKWCNYKLQHPSNYQGCSCTRKELQWGRVHNADPQASSGCQFTLKTISSEKSYTTAAANCVLESPPTNTHHQNITATVIWLSDVMWLGFG